MGMSFHAQKYSMGLVTQRNQPRMCLFVNFFSLLVFQLFLQETYATTKQMPIDRKVNGEVSSMSK